MIDYNPSYVMTIIVMYISHIYSIKPELENPGGSFRSRKRNHLKFYLIETSEYVYFNYCYLNFFIFHAPYGLTYCYKQTNEIFAELEIYQQTNIKI